MIYHDTQAKSWRALPPLCLSICMQAVGKITLPGGKEARDARVAPVSKPTEHGEAPKQVQRQQAQQGAQQGQQQPPLRAAVQKAQAKAEQLMAKHGTGKVGGVGRSGFLWVGVGEVVNVGGGGSFSLDRGSSGRRAHLQYTATRQIMLT